MTIIDKIRPFLYTWLANSSNISSEIPVCKSLQNSLRWINFENQFYVIISLERKKNAVNDVQCNYDDVDICYCDYDSGDEITFVCPCYHCFCNSCITETRKMVCHCFLF